MNIKLKICFGYIFAIFFGIYLAACSELQTNIEPQEPVKIHKEGINNPASQDFHGNLIRNNKWDMNQCKQCHGGNYSGGRVNVSCLSCHTEPTGPENCSTCHGSEISPAPPSDLDGNNSIISRGVGAHQTHLVGNLKGKIVSCTECHIVPSTLSEEGHIDSVNRSEVIMNSFLANVKTNEPGTTNYDLGWPVYIPEPAYNNTDQSCSNTYCHGAFKNGNLDNSPVWINPATSTCGTCHGNTARTSIKERALPKTVLEGGTHPGGLECYLCHGGVIDENLKFINASKHIDGKLNLFGNDVKY